MEEIGISNNTSQKGKEKTNSRPQSNNTPPANNNNTPWMLRNPDWNNISTEDAM